MPRHSNSFSRKPFKLSKTEIAFLHEVTCRVDEYDQPRGLTVCEQKFTCICRRAQVYHCKARGLVIKRPNFILNPRTPLKVRVPTIVIREDRNAMGDWVAQPFVLKHDKKLAKERIIKMLGTDVGYDIHAYNVGWYQGKPVMFDW